MKRLGILGSTRGTHLQTIVEAIAAKQLSADIAVVISNKSEAPILTRAQHLHLPAVFVDPTGLTRDDFDKEVSTILRGYAVDLIVLIGYMRILSSQFINDWSQKIINVHPSLLPAYAGLMDLDVHRA